MIADDRGSQIVDRRRSQRELFPYNRRRSSTIAEPTFSCISVSRSGKITGADRHSSQLFQLPTLTSDLCLMVCVQYVD